MIDSVSRHITLIYLDFRGGPSILRNIPICALSSIICIHVQPSIARIRKLKKDLAMCTLVIYAVQKNLNQMSHTDWGQTNCYFQYLPD